MRTADRDPFACPACGNKRKPTISDNGREGLDLTLLCENVGPDGDCNTGEPGPCGNEWEPAEIMAQIRPEWDLSDDREAIRRWWAGDSWDEIRYDLDRAIADEREDERTLRALDQVDE